MFVAVICVFCAFLSLFSCLVLAVLTTRLTDSVVKKPLSLLTLRDGQHSEKCVCTSKNLEHGSMEYLHAKAWILLVINS